MKRYAILIVCICMLLISTSTAYASESNVTSVNKETGETLNLFNSRVQVVWMPTVFGIQLPAAYHETLSMAV